MKKIVEVEYYIDEKRSRTEYDYSVKGDFHKISMGSVTHGPFNALDDVTLKLKELEEFYGQEKIIKSRCFVQATTRVGEKVEEGEKLRLSLRSSLLDNDELDRVEDIIFIVREEVLSETPVVEKEQSTGCANCTNYSPGYVDVQDRLRITCKVCGRVVRDGSGSDSII